MLSLDLAEDLAPQTVLLTFKSKHSEARGKTVVVSKTCIIF